MPKKSLDVLFQESRKALALADFSAESGESAPTCLNEYARSKVNLKIKHLLVQKNFRVGQCSSSNPKFRDIGYTCVLQLT